jgi:NhaA family Na+:H+ antiporter
MKVQGDHDVTDTEPMMASPKYLRPLTDFLHKEASAGILLVIGAAIAMIWANSPWSDSYVDLWNTHAVIGIGDFNIELTLREWINDAAMVIFFFVVGLEIKRELTQGELKDPRQASLPIIAAFGGMIVPALIFYSLNTGTDASEGWGIPMATDIAVVMGVVSLLGTRVPSWLKLFLLALAIVDDLGAIIVIAIFYSEGVSLTWLAVAIAALGVAAIIRTHVNFLGVYLLLGVICWVALHEAHVHATLAGVAFGLLAPVIPRRTDRYVDADELGLPSTAGTAHLVASQARNSVSVVEWLTYKLHPYSAWIIVPIFALANAGVQIPTEDVGETLSSRVTWGVILGLVVGKTIGVASATLLAVRLKIGTLPPTVTTRYVIGAAALAGIGFTVSLFVTELAFGHGQAGTEARLGVLIASILAAGIGTAICVPGHVDESDNSD